MSDFEDVPLVNFLQEVHPDNEVGKVISKFRQMELNGSLRPEPLLAEDKTRFVLFPIKHADVSAFIMCVF